jgi:hypothetical protein
MLTLPQRIARCDWERVEADLSVRGFATAPGILTRSECSDLVRVFGERRRFRKWIDMERHRFGRGEYAYFSEPLPRTVATLRRGLYGRLAPMANRFEERLGRDTRYPPTHAAYRAVCREAGQTRPTPLVLRYGPEGFNCLHRDLYGECRFPLQATIALTARSDYEGGEFLLVENRPRQQSRAEVIPLEQGELVIFFVAERPVDGAKRTLRAEVRHGVNRLRRGERHALGIIFHDAR